MNGINHNGCRDPNEDVQDFDASKEWENEWKSQCRAAQWSKIVKCTEVGNWFKNEETPIWEC